MFIPVLKVIHIAAACVFLGGGMLIAYFKLRADCSRDPRIMHWYHSEMVRADWIFTLPSGILLPLTGLLLADAYALPLSTPWIVAGFVAYCIAGILWVPAAVLQIKMRRLLSRCAEQGTPVPDNFFRYARIWTALGYPSFVSASLSIYFMAAKTARLPFF